MRKRISVCIASYNGEKFIEEQLRSILPQLAEGDEIIISDDGSKDRTLQIAKEVCGDILKTVDGPKKGFACNFFNAAYHASGDIIFLCDQDDIWAEDKVEKVLKIFDEDPKCTTVLHEMYTFHEHTSEKGEQFPIRYKKGFSRNVLFSAYWGCCMAFRKEFIEGFLPVTEPRLAHDQLIGLASERVGKTVFLPEKLLYHRMHGGNKSTSGRSLKDRIAFRCQIFSEYEEMEAAYYDKKAPGAELATKKGGSLKTAAQILMLLFLADCCITGGGRLVDFGFLSLRMLFFALAFIVSLPLVIQERKRLVSNRFVQLTVLFGAVVAVWAVYGFVRHNPTSFIVSDITRYLSFMLLPGMLCCFSTRKDFEKLINVIFWSSVALALAGAVLQFVMPHVDNEGFRTVYYFLNRRSIGGITKMPSGSYRLFFRSGIFTQIAILLGIKKFWDAGTAKKKLLIAACEGLLVFAWIISYTRGLWLGLAVSVVVVLIWQPQVFGKCLKVALCALLAVAVIIGLSAINEGKPGVLIELYGRINATSQGSVEQDDNSEYDDKYSYSEDIREKSKKMDIEYIKQSPVIGRGLGAYLEGLRDTPVTEYTYLDVLMKFGIAGTLFFIMAYFAFVPRAFIHRIYKPKKEPERSFYSLVTLLIAGYIGMAVTSITNPFIVSPLGISFLMVVELAVCNYMKFEKEMV